MPLTVPNLDDREFIDLVREGISMLPRYAPEWTNHNPSDPGITLIELLAYFTEIFIYRLNRVTRESKIKFLQLLREVAPDEKANLANPATPLETVDHELRCAVLGLRQLQRAVTPKDYEDLARQVTAQPRGEEPRVARARCFAQQNLDGSDGESRLLVAPGHVSLVIVPNRELESEGCAALIANVRAAIEPKGLLTTRLHVLGPFYLWVSLGAVIRTQPGISFADVRIEAMRRLQEYFNPFPGGGSDGEGWAFGRAVHISEIYERLEQIAGVDYVEDVRVLSLGTSEKALDDKRAALGIQIGVRSTVGVDSRLGVEPTADQERLMRSPAGKLAAVTLRPYELLRILVHEDDLAPGGS